MDWDILLLNYMKELTSISTTLGNRILHMEAYQADESKAVFPCMVYSITSDVSMKESKGSNGIYVAQLNFAIIASNTDIIKAVRKDLVYLESEEFDDVLIEDDGALLTIDIVEDSEDDFFAQEQQEKGYKTANIMIGVLHTGK